MELLEKLQAYASLYPQAMRSFVANGKFVLSNRESALLCNEHEVPRGVIPGVTGSIAPKGFDLIGAISSDGEWRPWIPSIHGVASIYIVDVMYGCDHEIRVPTFKLGDIEIRGDYAATALTLMSNVEFLPSEQGFVTLRGDGLHMLVMGMSDTEGEACTST